MLSFHISVCVMVSSFTIKTITAIEPIANINTFGLDYAPYRDGQNPDWGGRATRDQIFEDMSILKKVTTDLRFYGMGDQTNTMIEAAHFHGLKVHIQAWLGKNLKNNKWQISQLIQMAHNQKYRKTVQSLIVGSETLYRKDLNETQLLKYIQQVKKATKTTGIPVTVGNIQWPQAIGDACDFIMFHKHPYWEGQPATMGASNILAAVTMYKNRFPGKKIYVGETGWPTGNNNRANVENQYTFLIDMVNIMNNNPNVFNDQVKVFIFEAFDEAWKGLSDGSSDEGKVGGNWGLFYSNRTAKPAASWLFFKEGAPPTHTVIPTLIPKGFKRIMEEKCNWLGGDIKNQGNVADANKCLDLCKKVIGCSKISYSPYNSGTCWFKNDKAVVKETAKKNNFCSTLVAFDDDDNVDKITTDVAITTATTTQTTTAAAAAAAATTTAAAAAAATTTAAAAAATTIAFINNKCGHAPDQCTNDYGETQYNPACLNTNSLGCNALNKKCCQFVGFGRFTSVSRV